MSDWKLFSASIGYNRLVYQPGSWRDLWRHFRDLLAGHKGHGLAASVWAKINGEAYGSAAKWSRPLNETELDYLNSNPGVTLSELQPEMKAGIQGWWDIDTPAEVAEEIMDTIKG